MSCEKISRASRLRKCRWPSYHEYRFIKSSVVVVFTSSATAAGDVAAAATSEAVMDVAVAYPVAAEAWIRSEFPRADCRIRIVKKHPN